MYREERELTVFLVVDDSLSMTTGPGSVSRREKALEAAALIAFAAEQNASPVGMVMFDGVSGKVFKPRSGRDQVLSILTSLDRREKPVAGSVLGSALAGASRVLRSRSLVVIISDFRTTGYEKALGILSRRHDVLAVRVISPADSELPNAGYVPLRRSRVRDQVFLSDGIRRVPRALGAREPRIDKPLGTRLRQKGSVLAASFDRRRRGSRTVPAFFPDEKQPASRDPSREN